MASCGIYVIEGPNGFYVGESANAERRDTYRLAQRLGWPAYMAREMPNSTKGERLIAEAEVAEELRAEGKTLVSMTNGEAIACAASHIPEHRNWQRTEERRRATSRQFKGTAKTEEWKAKVRATWTPERRRAQSERLRRALNKPGVQERRLASLRRNEKGQYSGADA